MIEHTDESVAGGIEWDGVSEFVRGRDVDNCKKRWELLEAQVGGELDILEEGADQGDIYERKIQFAGESVAPWTPLEVRFHTYTLLKTRGFGSFHTRRLFLLSIGLESY